VVQVGVRELRNGLTRYLRLVEKGQQVMVKRGKRPIAVLHKPERVSAQTEEEIISALIAEGKLIGPVKRGTFKPFKPIKMGGKPLSRMIIEDRR
jgi:antitoxin (DNA-binding transcriptional repressor) of toxin-antitoxin stability system